MELLKPELVIAGLEGSEVLKTVAEAAAPDEVQALGLYGCDMLALMAAKKGIGLAANQVGLLKRVFVMQSPEFKYSKKICINPVIQSGSDEMVTEYEGCLSFPGVHVRISRHKSIQVQYLDGLGNLNNKILHGLEARIFQHELDHLNGINIVDHAKDASDYANHARAAGFSATVAAFAAASLANNQG